MDVLTWLDAHAGAVQAVTALVIVILTGVLVWATVWYARSAKLQVAELVAARLASVEPFVHIPWAKVDLGDPPTYVGTVVTVGIVNVGVGPALSVRAHA